MICSVFQPPSFARSFSGTSLCSSANFRRRPCQPAPSTWSSSTRSSAPRDYAVRDPHPTNVAGESPGFRRPVSLARTRATWKRQSTSGATSSIARQRSSVSRGRRGLSSFGRGSFAVGLWSSRSACTAQLCEEPEGRLRLVGSRAPHGPPLARRCLGRLLRARDFRLA